MKLKKIASLALAGIMAVSMLAGCKAAATIMVRLAMDCNLFPPALNALC